MMVVRGDMPVRILTTARVGIESVHKTASYTSDAGKKNLLARFVAIFRANAINLEVGTLKEVILNSTVRARVLILNYNSRSVNESMHCMT